MGEDGGYTLLVLSVAGSADKNVLIVLGLHSRHTSRILAETMKIALASISKPEL